MEGEFWHEMLMMGCVEARKVADVAGRFVSIGPRDQFSGWNQARAVELESCRL